MYFLRIVYFPGSLPFHNIALIYNPKKHFYHNKFVGNSKVLNGGRLQVNALQAKSHFCGFIFLNFKC